MCRIITGGRVAVDRNSTRLNSSHLGISYAVFCLKKEMHMYASDVNAEQEGVKTSGRKIGTTPDPCACELTDPPLWPSGPMSHPYFFFFFLKRAAPHEIPPLPPAAPSPT